MLRNIIKLLVFCTMLFQLNACNYVHSKMKFTMPAAVNAEPPPGPPIYQQGFRDGFQSGYSGYAGSFSKMFYKWKQDPELVNNEMYYRVWKDAYSYGALIGMMTDEHALGNWR